MEKSNGTKVRIVIFFFFLIRLFSPLFYLSSWLLDIFKLVPLKKAWVRWLTGDLMIEQHWLNIAIYLVIKVHSGHINGWTWKCVPFDNLMTPVYTITKVTVSTAKSFPFLPPKCAKPPYCRYCQPQSASFFFLEETATLNIVRRFFQILVVA